MESSPAQNVLDPRPDPTAEEQPIFAHRQESGRHAVPTLQFSRKDLEFRFDEEGMVDIALRVTNPGPGASPPRRGRIEVAAFGAFLPWAPLTTFRVPRLRPGESSLIQLRVPRTALGGDLPPEPPRTVKPVLPLVARAGGTMEDLLRSAVSAFRVAERREPGAPIFAGNLNVHIGTKSVERHLSGALRVYAGRMNIAVFQVGTGNDEYRFEVRGDDPTWQTSLHQMCEEFGEVMAGEWYSLPYSISVIVAVNPPPDGRRGAVEVHVERRSTGRIAIVEFDLDPKALGAGCYRV